MTNSRQVAAVVLAAVMLVGCSREKIDWKSAEAADTVEAYDHFLERHPDGDLSTQARARVAQLDEDRDWKRASAADTLDAYRQFLAQHENGKWAGEARIRVENFALDGTPTGPMRPSMDAEVAPASAPAHAPPPPPSHVATATSPAKTNATTTVPTPAVPQAGPAASQVSPAKTAPQFGIQLGAFSSQQAALTDWKRIQARFNADLHGLFAHAVPVAQASGQLFRLQAPVGDEAKARAICTSLAKQSQPCVVVLPQAH